jgi:NAD(P)H-hydrate epimerase
LWAQQSNKNVFTGVQAASIGAYLHGLAGDLALKQYPERTLLASDLADLMPVVFRKILKGRKK